MGNTSAHGGSPAVPIRGQSWHTQILSYPTLWPPPFPHLIFRLLFLQVQDIMQHHRGLLWGRRHLMYVTVTTADHWPQPGHRRVCCS